ncbi:MAG: ABC transporter permease, partial [Planctomycetes bacterium]|nr:ABC transporter permease [Planctomycetota bacterium]
MHHWWQLGTRNWSTSPGRSLASILSVALGVATVVTITSFYETARRAIRNEVVTRWLGAAHLSVHPPGAHWGTLDTALAAEVVKLDNVRHATGRLRRRAHLFHVTDSPRLLDADGWRVDAIGINPETEEPFLNLPNLTGRMIEPGERGVAVIEREAADLWGVGLGGTIALSANREVAKVTLSIVGLFDTRRVAEFQAPSVYAAIADVQELKNEPGAASAIDLMLQDTSPAALAQTQAVLERYLDEPGVCPQCKVVSSAARQMVLDEAERMTRFILTLTAFVALLTSFFIILTTMSMSLFERRRLLGVMRCVGLTRAQLAALVSIELLPLGLAGTMLGVLLGIGVNEATARWAAHATVRLSTWGVGLAVASGIITTLVCTIILWLQVGRVAPLSAVNPHTQAPKLRYLYISGVIGVGLLTLHEACIGVTDQTRWLSPGFALAGAASLYLGYILIVPALVVLLGRPLARLVGPLLGIRRELAEDQFGRAPWRSTGVCWVLLVGLSLIVYIGIGSEAVLAIWDFPSRLPEAFVWSQQYVPGPVVERVRHAPGLRDVTIMTDVDCEIATPDAAPTSETDGLMKWLLQKVTRPVFVAAEPGRIYNIFKITFIEGDAMDTKAKFARGGYVLIPVQTSRTKQLHLGDHVTVTIKGISADFEIAGVIQSPALDLAVTAFQAESYMQFASASALLGTQQDLKDKFGLDVVSLILGNLDLPPTPLPDWFEKDGLPDAADERDLATRMLAISAVDEVPEERVTL